MAHHFDDLRMDFQFLKHSKCLNLKITKNVIGLKSFFFIAFLVLQGRLFFMILNLIYLKLITIC